ncbi:MAG: hypothetical protein AAF810_01735 [Cyanobacteria bacterium P01_D01_bin.36]
MQPLTDEQIEQYFRRLHRLDIWQAIQDESELTELLSRSVTSQREDETPFLRVPLFLRMLAVTYADDEQANRLVTNKSELFEAYIKRQLSATVREQSRQSRLSQPQGYEWAYPNVEREPAERDTKRYLR